MLWQGRENDSCFHPFLTQVWAGLSKTCGLVPINGYLRDCQLSLTPSSETEILLSDQSSHPGGGEEPVFPSSLTLSWVRQLTSGQYGKDRNWMYSFQEACFRGEADPPPSLSPLLPNGWNVNLIAAAPAATLNHKNHCQLKPQMGEQDRRKPDTMSLQYQLWTKW